MDDAFALPERELVVAARGGDGAAFERIVAGYRRELLAHCYRLLGSRQDAEDALQESLLGAWRGLAGHLIVGQVVLGDGTPAFGNGAAPPLHLLDTCTWDESDNVLVRYAAGSAA
jgi:hypothetical protein